MKTILGICPRGVPGWVAHAPSMGMSGIGSSAQTTSIASGAASGAAAGSAAGPWGAVIGGVVGGGAAYMSSNDSGGGTSQLGPGSHTYWQAQLQRLQAITHSGASADVVAAARALAKAYKAKVSTSAHAYPVIPESQIVALERAASSGGGTLMAGWGTSAAVILVVGVVAFGAWNLYRGKRSSGRRRRTSSSTRKRRRS